MRLDQQYQELLRLKKEINHRLKAGVGFQEIKELMLYLAHDRAYAGLKLKENQLIMLECFFNIWLVEKKKLPELGIETDIFNQVSGLDDVERKYRKVQYCGLRIENDLPEEYCEQALEWLVEDEISGVAIGKIIVLETKEREGNLLRIARWLREKGDVLNALLLLQYGNEAFPGREELLREEAEIWLLGEQEERALALLAKIEEPSQKSREKHKSRETIKNMAGGRK